IGPIGDLAHELEYLYESLSSGALQASAELFALVQRGHDRLAQMLDGVRAGQPCPPADRLINAIQNFSHPLTVETPPVPPVPVKTDAAPPTAE
ncbi:hypothetical protein, partial [Pseudomonas viridiflava]|uniref:hypothetical protein n=1 Tax=Pseudomonas viridiflava TaxID=33069 RepID=UPI0013CE4D63